MNNKAPIGLHSLYIHWPFCSAKCHYCDFVAFEQHEEYQEEYHKALLKEIESYGQNLHEADRHIQTIFIGGGTPSLYPLDLLQELFDVIGRYWDKPRIKEITLEANPADITEERLDIWESVGINRLSCGVQVLDDAVLRQLNRRQTTHDVVQAMRIIPKYFGNVSVDLIIGLPGVTHESWRTTVQTAMTWPIAHISLYFLTVHEQTPLYYKLQQHKLVLDHEDTILDQYNMTVDVFAREGFEQYEISNFARPGCQSLHNKSYWDRYPYRGFGVGASSFDGRMRTINEKNIINYLKKTQTETNSVGFYEELTDEQAFLEIIMLDLRQSKGIDLHHVVYLEHARRFPLFLQRVDLLTSHGFLEKRMGNLVLTRRGMIMENEVVAKLMDR